MDILSFMFPKHCIGCGKIGSFLCDQCLTYLDFNVFSVCGVCGKATLSGLTHPVCRTRYSIDGVFASLVYNTMAKKLIRRFKFSPFVSELKGTLAELCFEGVIQQERFIQIDKAKGIFTPIPLHKSRLKERGYNQAYLLSVELGKLFALPVEDMMLRIRKTTSQVDLSQKERRENIKNAFLLKKNIDVKGKTVFLVDDIVTSGATMNESARILKRNGAKQVFGIAIAHGN